MIATYSIMIICTIVYLLTMYLSSKYSDGVAYILLGADYMTFTKGLNQFYRLIICGLVHGGFIHLISNMYSLFVLGRFVERNYGSLKFILILMICTFVGSISQSILSSNGITVGYVPHDYTGDRIRYDKKLPCECHCYIFRWNNEYWGVCVVAA